MTEITLYPSARVTTLIDDREFPGYPVIETSTNELCLTNDILTTRIGHTNYLINIFDQGRRLGRGQDWVMAVLRYRRGFGVIGPLQIWPIPEGQSVLETLAGLPGLLLQEEL